MGIGWRIVQRMSSGCGATGFVKAVLVVCPAGPGMGAMAGPALLSD